MLTLLASLLWLPTRNLSAQDVFVSGQIEQGGHYDTFRIPALCRTNRGTLLAFAEGRQSVSDQAANALVMRRRERGSREWSPLATIASDQPHSLNNPCVIATKHGRVWLMYQRYPSGLNERTTRPGFDPKSSCLTFLIWSDDDGRTWSNPLDVSRSVKSPTSQSEASGPGMGIELERGTHRGRLVFPMNEGSQGRYEVFAVYSDDQGKTWRRGKIASRLDGANPNETQVAELANGDLYMNARNQASRRNRLVTWSHDGGDTWESIKFDPQLTDPVCQGSTLRLSFRPDVLLFCNPNHSSSRINGTLRLSKDGGRTWPQSFIVKEGSFAYSSMCRISDGKVGILYESVEKTSAGKEKYRIKFEEIETATAFR